MSDAPEPEFSEAQLTEARRAQRQLHLMVLVVFLVNLLLFWLAMEFDTGEPAPPPGPIPAATAPASNSAGPAFQVPGQSR